jgi:hypothetical protein
VPLYAIDYEIRPPKGRRFGLCRFSDGGLCSNFPIHLFDAAIPRWPTFGMWLDKASPHWDQAVWLPDFVGQGRADTWLRFEPAGSRPMLRQLSGFLWAAFMSAKDWKDRYGLRMPHVRNRVARLYLRKGEGELNIAMPADSIMTMAHRYGTWSGREFVRRFVHDPAVAAGRTAGELPRHWREHLAVRFLLLLDTVRERVTGLTANAAGGPHGASMDELITSGRLTAGLRRDQPELGADEQESLHRMLDALRALEAAFESETLPLPYGPIPAPELRMRTPV